MNEKYLKQFYKDNKEVLNSKGILLPNLYGMIANFIEHGFLEKTGLKINSNLLLNDFDLDKFDFEELSERLEERFWNSKENEIHLCKIWIDEYDSVLDDYYFKFTFAKKEGNTGEECEVEYASYDGLNPQEQYEAIVCLLASISEDNKTVDRFANYIEEKFITEEVKKELE